MDVGSSSGRKMKPPSSQEKKEIPLSDVASMVRDILLEQLEARIA